MTTTNVANIAVNKSRVKEYSNRTIYLDNNTEFQIELFNPYHYEIGVSATFDGSEEGNQLLILKPGERYWLDRYLNTPKKFKFSTYMVEDSEEAKSATSENGDVIIRIYKAKENKPKVCTKKTIDWTYNPNDWKITYEYGLTRNLNSISSGDSSFGSFVTEPLHDYVSELKCSCNTNSVSLNLNNINTIETGRVKEGSYSSQTFTETDQEFESFPFKTERIKILPSSRKPLTTSDLSKKFCYNCGRKLKEKFKFCPFCGVNLNENGEV